MLWVCDNEGGVRPLPLSAFALKSRLANHFLLSLFEIFFLLQAFDLAYHLWCGSAKFQHEQQKQELFKFDQRIKKLEIESREIQRKLKKGIRVNDSARCLSQTSDVHLNAVLI